MNDVETSPAAPAAGSWKELSSVAVPLVISNGTLSLMYVVDRVFLTWYSPDALAASLPAMLLHWMIMSFVLGTAGYTGTFVAQYDGAGRPERVSAAVWQGVWFTLIAGGILWCFAPLAAPILALARHDSKLLVLEEEFFGVLCRGSLPFILSAVLASFFSGRGKTWVVLIANGITCAATVVLDYWMIFGAAGVANQEFKLHPDYPLAGVRGSAWATVLAAGIGASFYVLVLAFGRDGRRYRIWSQWRPDFDLLRRLMRFGMPAGAHLFLEIVCFSCFLLLVGRFGPAALAASNVAFNLNSLAFVPMAGLAMAVSVLVGRRIGEGRPELAVRTVHRAFGLTTAYMASFGALYVLAPDLILAPYRLASHGPEFGAYRDTIVVLLRFVALYCMFDGAVLIYNAGLRGAGDTRVPLLLEMACGWTLAFLPTWLVYRYGYETGRLSDGAALLASWTALSVYLMTLGTLLFVRFRRGAWKKMKVIERVAGEEEPEAAPAEATDTIPPEATTEAATSGATAR